MWYPVQNSPGDGYVHVRGANAEDIPVRPELVRVIDREPDTVTRVQQATFHFKAGEPAPPLSYYGVCPRGHWIRGVRGVDTSAHCDTCERSYPVDDEQHT